MIVTSIDIQVLYVHVYMYLHIRYQVAKNMMNSSDGDAMSRYVYMYVMQA